MQGLGDSAGCPRDGDSQAAWGELRHEDARCEASCLHPARHVMTDPKDGAPLHYVGSELGRLVVHEAARDHTSVLTYVKTDV